MRPCVFGILIVSMAGLAAALPGCTRAGGATGAADQATLRSEARASADEVDRLERTGDFVAYTAQAELAAQKFPADPRLRVLAAEALLAAGDPAPAEVAALEAERLAGPGQAEVSSIAIKLWATARLRQGLPLETAQLARIALDDPALQTVLAWSDLLAGASPYQLPGRVVEAASPPVSEAAPRSLAAELLAIDGRMNGEPCRRVFVDTGAQHTVVTRAAAAAARVRTLPGEIELAGFASSTAEAGLIDALELGSLTIKQVPVLVADSPALMAADGSMSLGTDLLYHLRVTLDYPARQVAIEPARRAMPEGPIENHTTAEPAVWRVPLWTFARLPLATARDGQGDPLRVLVDTGDRSGTYISYRWARRALPQLAGVHSGLVFRFKKRDLTLPVIELGTRALADWPVVNTLPTELDRLDAVDVMLGHDLLQRYRTTIDLPGRELRLTASDPQANQNPVRPAARGEHDLP